MDIVHSFCFQENKVTWLYAERHNRVLTVRRAEESLLPIMINAENLERSATAIQVANHLTTLAREYDLQVRQGLFLLSPKFALVRPVVVDKSLPSQLQPDYPRQEMLQTLTLPEDEYLIYVPQYERENNGYLLKLAIALNIQLYRFFQRVVEESGWQVNHIGLSSFALDALYRATYPDLTGQSLLVNFTERGYELTLVDENGFLDVFYRPYSRNIESIERLEEEAILSNFDAMLEDIQRPEPLVHPKYNIAHILVFGSYFRPEWKDMLISQTTIPIQIFDLSQLGNWQLVFDDPDLSAETAFRFIEPIAQIIAGDIDS
ncbi:MAG: hypothetical protein D6715_04290 [Calditrichaeota bacterium]|nr:MAG: hypothetical protein D6715_04290 [Calditrichota bacterium]